MSFFKCPVAFAEPYSPILEDNRLELWVGSGVDAGLYASRMYDADDFGGKWIVSDTLYPSLQIGETTLSARPSTVDGFSWFEGGGERCYYSSTLQAWIYTSAEAGYAPTAEWDAEQERYVGDGWYSVGIPTSYEDTGRARPQGAFDDGRGNLDVSVVWPRLAGNGYSTFSGQYPFGEYPRAYDAPDFELSAIGCPQWRKGSDLIARSIERDSNGHFLLLPFSWNDSAGAYVLGTYQSDWLEGREPTPKQNWELTHYVMIEGEPSAVDMETATWVGWRMGEETTDVFAGAIAVWR